MPTLNDMANIDKAAKYLVEAAKSAYPNAGIETLKEVCKNAVYFAFSDEQTSGKGDRR